MQFISKYCFGLTERGRWLLWRVTWIHNECGIVEVEIGNQFIQVKAGDTLDNSLSPNGFKHGKIMITYLNEGPTLRLPPGNVVGSIEVVPDVEHLPTQHKSQFLT
jgi:hypothetical protein